MADIRNSPEFEQLVALARASVTRRRFLSALGATGAIGALSACGTKGAAQKANPTKQAAVQDLSDTDKVVNWSNWPLYIDVDDKTKKHPTIDAFEKQTGIKVNYTEDINDNDEFFGKIKPQLAAGQDTGRDLITLTDWMAGRLIRLNWVQQVNLSNIPNHGNIRSALQHPGFDPNRQYTMPWQSGLTGIGYNPKATGGKAITSIEQLLTDPALKGKVTALTEMRDTMGLILAAQGKDPANFTDSDFSGAIDMLRKAVSSGQIRKFTGNDYAQGLASGNIAACFAWSGDIIQLQADNPHIKFVVPETGAMLWSDNLMIPNKAKHKKNAELIMNYYYDPKVAAQVAAYVNYICPVEGAKEAMAAIDKTLVDNPLIFPDDATLAKTKIFKALTSDEESKYNQDFQSVSGS